MKCYCRGIIDPMKEKPQLQFRDPQSHPGIVLLFPPHITGNVASFFRV